MPKKKRNTKKTKSWQEGLYGLCKGSQRRGLPSFDAAIYEKIDSWELIVFNEKTNEFHMELGPVRKSRYVVCVNGLFNNPVQYIGYPTVAATRIRLFKILMGNQ